MFFIFFRTFLFLVGLDIFLTTILMISEQELRNNNSESKIIIEYKNEKVDQNFKY